MVKNEKVDIWLKKSKQDIKILWPAFHHIDKMHISKPFRNIWCDVVMSLRAFEN